MFWRSTRRLLFTLLVATFASAIAVAPRLSAQAVVKGVTDLKGRSFDPFQRSSGDVIVFLFIRTDCPISNRYAPAIQEMSRKFARNAEFFLVYPIASETSAQIEKHKKEYGYTLVALRDTERALIRAASVTITPEAAVFNRTGKLLYHGRIDDWYAEFGRSRPVPTTHELSSAIQATIEGKPVPVSTAPAVGCYLPDAP